MVKILIIICTYNEIENIERLIPRVLEQKAPGAELEVLVVDDSSADGTGEAVARLAAENPAVHLLSRPGKLGLGTAYIAGFRYGLERGFDFVGTMDADFSHNPDHLPAFVEAVEGADVVIGSRYIPGGGIRNWGIHRHVLSATANFLARLIGGLKPRDCTTGYRLYRADFLRRLDLDGITSHGYSCLMELVYVCQKKGARMVESPIVFLDREEGQTKMSRKEIYTAIATLYRLGLRRFRG